MTAHGKKIFVAAAVLLFPQVAGRAQITTRSTAVSHPGTKASAKRQVASPLDEAVHALFAVHRFEQTAISPDGKNVAWVETLIGKDGAPDGHSAIYFAA